MRPTTTQRPDRLNPLCVKPGVKIRQPESHVAADVVERDAPLRDQPTDEPFRSAEVVSRLYDGEVLLHDPSPSRSERVGRAGTGRAAALCPMSFGDGGGDLA